MMTYTIAEAAKRSGLSAHTLRYYDKEGLLPYVERTQSGIRAFKESDFEWLATINCLKDTGMPIKKIKDFIDWCVQGDDTIELRLEFLKAHKKDVENQLAETQRHMERINYKICYYEAAKEAGTTEIYEECEVVCN